MDWFHPCTCSLASRRKQILFTYIQQWNPHTAYTHHTQHMLWQTHKSSKRLKGALTITSAVKLDWATAGPYTGQGTTDIHDVNWAVSKVQVQRAIQDHIIHIWSVQRSWEGHISNSGVRINYSSQQNSILYCISFWYPILHIATGGRAKSTHLSVFHIVTYRLEYIMCVQFVHLMSTSNFTW